MRLDLNIRDDIESVKEFTIICSLGLCSVEKQINAIENFLLDLKRPLEIQFKVKVRLQTLLQTPRLV